VMPMWLLDDGQPEDIGQFFGARPLSEGGFDIKLLFRKKAASEFAVGCEPQPVAGTAEMPGHRRYNSDFTCSNGQ